MNFLRPTKLLIVAATLLLTASLSFAATQTEEHPKPVHHKAHTATHHSAPKAAHHDNPKALHPEIPKAAHHSGKKAKKKHPRGQQAIDGERARQIQEALVREHYMSGQPSGTWDSETQAAMRRYQTDQGWQSKTVPDSRALIRLGLGPDHGHLLNPESAMTTEPHLPHGTQTSRAPVSALGTNSGASIQPAQSSSPIVAPAADVSPSR
jgi:putative peptidoglycan binding protein